MIFKKLCVVLILSSSLVVYPGEGAVDKDGLIRIFKESGPNLYRELIDLWKTKTPFKAEFDKVKVRLTRFGECHTQSDHSQSPSTKLAWTDKERRYSKTSCRKDQLKASDWTILQLKNGQDILPDHFRRLAMSSFERAVGAGLSGVHLVKNPAELTVERKKRHIVWAAIGTPGPGSDIDTVANYHPDEEKPLPKIVIETMAKSLFDALGIAMYDQATGVNFDTESYIDVTADLDKAKYMERIRNPVYKNLGFTLALLQIVRQLEHGIYIQTEKDSPHTEEKKVFDLVMLNKSWEKSSAKTLLVDATAAEATTRVDGTAKQKIEKYLPIINHLARKAGELEETDDLAASKIKGILGTYFPEAYYTREALAHVCYSDDRYSQLLLSKASDMLKKGDTITEEDAAAFKASAITPDYFIYLVSALENFGYFLHKVNGDKSAYESLKESSKYLFRIARALAGYWAIDVDAEMENPSRRVPNPTVKDNRKQYIVTLFEIASKLERLKRGFLPFSSIDDLKKAITKIENVFEGRMSDQEHSKRDRANLFSNFKIASKIYSAHIDIFLSKQQKETKLKEVIEKMNLVVVWNEEKKMFDLAPGLIESRTQEELDTEQERIDGMSVKEKKAAASEKLKVAFKRSSAMEFVSLLNLIIGIDNNSAGMKKQKMVEEAKLQQNTDFPNWRVNKQDSNVFTFSKERAFTASAAQLREFLKGLNSFLIYTTANYQKKNTFTFTPVGLNVLSGVEIAKAINPVAKPEGSKKGKGA